MKACVWQTLLQFCECPDRDIQSLMPLKSTREHDQRAVAVRAFRSRSEDSFINVINEYRTLLTRCRSGRVSGAPEVTRQNDMVCRRGGKPFQPFQHFHKPRA